MTVNVDDKIRKLTAAQSKKVETRTGGADCRGNDPARASQGPGSSRRYAWRSSWGSPRTAFRGLCRPATRTRRWPTRDRRSVTTAGVTMVLRSTDQRVVVSAFHDLNSSTEGLHRPRTSDCERGV